MKTQYLGEINTETRAMAGDIQYLAAWFEGARGRGTLTLYIHCEETTGTPQAHSIAYEPISKFGVTPPAEYRQLTDVNPKPALIYLCNSALTAYTGKVPAVGECHMSPLETDIPWEGVLFTVTASAGAVATVKLEFYLVYD